MTLHHTEFDTIVIGGGQAGPSLAAKLDGRGERVAVFQDGPFGGTCLNDGCRPTKALRASAHAAHVARTAAAHGVHVGEVTVDVSKAIARKDELIDGWRDSGGGYFEDHETISYVTARARIAGREGDLFRVEFGGDGAHELTVVTAPRIVLNPGARSVPPPIDGLDEVDFLDHHTILDLTDLPARLAVIGGSYIGLELGQIWARFGSHVTVLQAGEHIMPREDPDIADVAATFLRDEGLDIRTGVNITRADRRGEGAVLTLADGSTVEADRVLVAAGRIPNSDDLGLDTVGVDTDGRGYITTDEHFQTSVLGIYALGDVNGRGAFTHTSYQDHEILAEHLGGEERSVAGRIPTYAMFTDPPLGRVGMTLAQAREEGINVAVANYDMAGVARAALDGVTAGTIRLVVDADRDRLVGAAVLGHHGDEVIHALSMLMHLDGPASALHTWLTIHPTVAELLPTVYGALEPDES
ncbi:FAD-dependent oxidoreductase [Demequina sp. SO4-13]|uniref:FAD-dependent oxidoreductase n=1 Tax=Demequina sp. SO4-13 TaxID=3401027 RepID=UPI003AF48179